MIGTLGPTIPAAHVERLFEPFQQGIEIVRAHCGTIDVHSQDDLTTFAVTLPRAAASGVGMARDTSTPLVS